jgi:hypothetical protein
MFAEVVSVDGTGMEDRDRGGGAGAVSPAAAQQGAMGPSAFYWYATYVIDLY